MGNHSDTGDELDEIYDSGATDDPGTNPSELDDDNGVPVRLNPVGDSPQPSKTGMPPNSSK